MSAGPAGAQLVTDQTFSGFSTGAISTDVLTVGETTVGGVHAARAANVVSSKGLTAIVDELGQNVSPATAGKHACRRGLEVGLVVPAAQQTTANQLLLSELVEATAPPPSDLITKEIASTCRPSPHLAPAGPGPGHLRPQRLRHRPTHQLRVGLRLQPPGLGCARPEPRAHGGVGHRARGGIRCNIPLGKTATPNPATAGETVTRTISIPSDPALFATMFACDLIAISAADTHDVKSGNPRIQLTGASNGGVLSGQTVPWPNLGKYRRGDPPIRVTVTGRVIGGTGELQDTARVSATAGHCTGGAAGQALVGAAQFQGAALSGSVTLIGPGVGRGQLATTGEDSPRDLLFGGALLLLGLGLRRRLRRRPDEVTST